MASSSDGKAHAEPLPTGQIPRQVGGMDSDCPVWTLRDAEVGEIVPTFPGLAIHLVITDGSGSQVHFYRFLNPTVRATN